MQAERLDCVVATGVLVRIGAFVGETGLLLGVVLLVGVNWGGSLVGIS